MKGIEALTYNNEAKDLNELSNFLYKNLDFLKKIEKTEYIGIEIKKEEESINIISKYGKIEIKKSGLDFNLRFISKMNVILLKSVLDDLQNFFEKYKLYNFNLYNISPYIVDLKRSISETVSIYRTTSKKEIEEISWFDRKFNPKEIKPLASLFLILFYNAYLKWGKK